MKRRSRVGKIIGLLFFLWLVGSYVGSWYSTRTRPRALPAVTEYFETGKDVVLSSQDGVTIRGWLVKQPNMNDKPCVILLAGIGANRMAMVKRAQLYIKQGFSVLLPDLRGTGSSEGELITFGWQERFDLLACYDYLAKQGFDQIAVHGISLGAATLAYSLPEQSNYTFLVLESPYDNIDQALKNRLEVFHVPMFLAAAMRVITEWRIEGSTQQLSPEDYVALIQCPTLLMAGDQEQKVKKAETEKIFSKIGTAQKELFFFQGAKHQDFYHYDADLFEQTLEKWLAKR